jgi:hypothetical protein
MFIQIIPSYSRCYISIFDGLVSMLFVSFQVHPIGISKRVGWGNRKTIFSIDFKIFLYEKVSDMSIGC